MFHLDGSQLFAMSLLMKHLTNGDFPIAIDLSGSSGMDRTLVSGGYSSPSSRGVLRGVRTMLRAKESLSTRSI